LCAMVGAAFGLPATAVRAISDIELACHAAFAPGAGYVLYAGTGSVAAFVDANGQLQRAGGRGPIIDDAGGGHWIAREALRQVWRAEDAEPGAWQRSALAGALFEAMGGAGWAVTRQWVYGATRGELGTLALAVAGAAAAVPADTAALAILVQAGHELARLGQALLTRYGDRPIALAGRVFDLDPVIETTLRDALPRGIPVRRAPLHAHQTAARLAAERFTP
jgi:glucosamine kinase